jgi:hypothetical protein
MSVPGPPRIKRQPLASPNTLGYWWEPPTQANGTILAYKLVLTDGVSIVYTNSSIGPEIRTYFVGPPEFSLTNGTTYSATLQAINENGEGDVATFLDFIPGSKPNIAPSTISVSILGSNSALISWTPPSNTGSLDAPIQWYGVYATPTSGGSTIKNSVDGTIRNYHFLNLPNSSYNYIYSVYGVNCPGWSPVINSQVFPPNYGTNSILGFARQLADSSSTNVAPTSGGSLTIASSSLGSYDYSVKASSTTISSFTASDYFTATEDSRSAWVIVKGDLTINSGQTFIPSVRKLFTVLYVTGNLVNNGTISMTARGANHSGTGNSGGATTAALIRVAVGTLSSIVDPAVPAAGGGGGVSGYNGVAGSAGTAGGTGGGGGGCNNNTSVGFGSAGTSFTGGTGGGSLNGAGANGTANGGIGGAANVAPSAPQDEACGGGNPGGNNNNDASRSAPSGTGGVLIVICEGAISGSGSIQANGVKNQPLVTTNIGGGSTGGGSLTILHKNGCTITPTADGGASYTGGYARSGGAGGAGTARALAIGAN